MSESDFVSMLLLEWCFKPQSIIS